MSNDHSCLILSLQQAPADVDRGDVHRRPALSSVYHDLPYRLGQLVNGF